MKKRVCAVIGSRANYASIKSVLQSLKEEKNCDLSIVCFSSAVLDKYGATSTLMRRDGLETAKEIYTLIEGDNPVTMAKSTGLGLIELSSTFQELKPNIVLVVGDRYETMSATIAASYMNIIIAHTMGGEVTGTIDESIRHATTKFAHIHFVACEDARERVVKLGENPEYVYNVGCPRIDIVKNILSSQEINLDRDINTYGVGALMDLRKPFLILSYHPVTTEYSDNALVYSIILEALLSMEYQLILLWPNSDAGSDKISSIIRGTREKDKHRSLRVFKNIKFEDYIRLLNITQCLVGNSSSGIREGAYIGTPVVNIGSRQNGRQRGNNVIDVVVNKEQIAMAVAKQIEHGKYPSCEIYGDGTSAEKIWKILQIANPPVQKRICY